MTLTMIQKNGYEECGDCGGLILTDATWEGEDQNGKGWYSVTYYCEDCYCHATEMQPE